MDEINDSITFKARRHMADRIDKELIGAWRAGYNWLYIWPSSLHSPIESCDDWVMSYTYRSLPTMQRLHHNPLDMPMSEYPVGEIKSIQIEKYYHDG